MGLRELLILLLGLAIVAVILRGLYVALQARRGQIRLAIDKNIPQDVDLEAIEMAELPGGGARVVRRDGDEALHEQLPEDPITQANTRAESMALGRDDQAVPVLMDSVQVGSANFIDSDDEDDSEEDRDDLAEPIVAPEVPDEEDSWSHEAPEEESWRTEPQIPEVDRSQSEYEQEIEQLDQPDEENADDVLFDYQADVAPISSDGMLAVQPDYPDDESADDQDETVDDYDDYEEEYAEDYDAEYADDDEDSLQDSQARVEPSFNPEALGDDLESFSMTAGERIGGNPQIDSQNQTSTFAAADEEAVSPPGKRKSLFSALTGRIRSQMANLRDTAETQPEEPGYEDYDIEQDLDAELAESGLPDSIPTEQLDIESSLAQEDEDSVPESVDVQRAEPVTTELRAPSTGAQRTEVKQQESSSQSSEVLVLNVMAQEGREFRGEDLMHTVITSGLKFGDMQIFHHRFGNGSSGPVIFSLANVLNPGIFDLNNMSQFSTIGVSLFMAMPTPINNLDAFEQMLAVARQLCTTLDGELKDDHRNVMTAQTIEHYRQRIRDFELRQLKTAGSRG